MLSDGKDIGHWAAGNNAYGVCVIVVSLVLFQRLNLLDPRGVLLYVFGIGFYFGWLALESQAYDSWGWWFPRVYGSFSNAWGQSIVWATLSFVVV